MEDQPSPIAEFVRQKIADKAAKPNSVPKALPKTNGQEEKGSVHLAGEYYVAAELHRRRVHATITYGNAKSADVLAFSLDGERFARVEVKSSRPAKGSVLVWSGTLNRFVLKPNQFWVLCVVPDVGDEAAYPRFYVYRGAEMRDEIMQRFDAYAARRGGAGDPTRWMWSFSAAELKSSSAEGAWYKIIDYLQPPSAEECGAS